MSKPAADLVKRATAFGVEITTFVLVERRRREVPFEILDQVLSAGTSIGAHCAEADSASSRRHLIVLRLGALREAKECQHWLTVILRACRPASPEMVEQLLDEVSELVAILTTCVNRLRGNSEGL